MMSQYIFDNAAPQAGQRFASLQTLYDYWTIRHLEATGVGPGWVCWEVGAGGGSIARWLAERSGSTGYVLVTDIDPRYLVESGSLDRAPLEIRHHNIASDPLPAQAFDLIHARLVLMHVPAREQALERIVTALKPGGWLVIEDYDRSLIDRSYATIDARASALFQKLFTALDRLMEARDTNLAWGRTLYKRLQALDLLEVGMEGYVEVWKGKSPGAISMRVNFEQIQEEAVDAGLITNEEFMQALMLLDDPDFAYSAPVLFTAWGRRSEESVL
jgi:ubiquinone/menaquinone biosynthesis C-methylase UbiE